VGVLFVDDNLNGWLDLYEKCTSLMLTKFIDSEIKRQDMPMLIAVS